MCSHSTETGAKKEVQAQLKVGRDPFRAGRKQPRACVVLINLENARQVQLDVFASAVLPILRRLTILLITPARSGMRNGVRDSPTACFCA